MFQVLSFVALRGPVDKSGKCCQRGSHGGAHLGPAEWNCAATLWNGDSEKQDSSNFLEPGGSRRPAHRSKDLALKSKY